MVSFMIQIIQAFSETKDFDVQSLSFVQLCPSLSFTVSQDHIKAQKLVSFACWFMRLAEAAGVPCEVAFWIDYCCCEQEREQMGAGSAVRGMMKAVCRLMLRDEYRNLESQFPFSSDHKG